MFNIAPVSGRTHPDQPKPSADMVVVLPLTAGQEVWVIPGNVDEMYGAQSDGTILSWFSAHLVHAF